MYTIIVYNNTDTNIDNVEILYGRDLNNNINIETASNLQISPKEYKKINIMDTDFMKHPAPHNVYIKIGSTNTCVGYYEQGLGGNVEVVELYLDDEIKIHQYNHDSTYKKILRRHNKNPNELSWYDDTAS